MCDLRHYCIFTIFLQCWIKGNRWRLGEREKCFYIYSPCVWYVSMFPYFFNNWTNSQGIYSEGIYSFINHQGHSHTKRKDSLETRAAFSWILILTWNFGGGPSDSASTFFKRASASYFWFSYLLLYVTYVR